VTSIQNLVVKFTVRLVDTTLSGEINQLLQLQEKVEKINLVEVERKKRLKKSRSRDTNDKSKSSNKEFPGTDEKESACKKPSLVFNTTDEQKKILNDIISNKLHQDAEDYKYCGVNCVSWGGMKWILNEGPLSTTNDTSEKSQTNDVVNFYLKNCLSTHGLWKCGQETSQGNFFFFTTYL
jgi:hypothetical protein